MSGRGPRPPPPPVEVLPETEATREDRQQIGEKALVALCSVLRNARSYRWEHDVFSSQLDALQQAMLELLGSDGTFELDLAGDAFHVNGQPMRFLALARVKVEEGDRYWGVHAANVAVLAITFGSRLGMSKKRRHDLGMAALFHDVGMAAIPKTVLQKSGKLDERGLRAVKASPLLSARAILRDGEMSLAALERAQGAYECHLDLVPREDTVPEIGLTGRMLAICESFDALTTTRPFRAAHGLKEATRIMTSEQLFRFDPQLVDLFVGVVARMLAATAPAR